MWKTEKEQGEMEAVLVHFREQSKWDITLCGGSVNED